MKLGSRYCPKCPDLEMYEQLMDRAPTAKELRRMPK
jgi:hypothetical protein